MKIDELLKLSHCPKCNSSWDGGSILESFMNKKNEGSFPFVGLSDDEIKEIVEKSYQPPYRWKRQSTGVTFAINDDLGIGLVKKKFVKCPDCKEFFYDNNALDGLKKSKINMEPTTENKEGYNYEGHVKQVKALRQGLDGQLQSMKALPSSRESSLAITKIQEGIMWLGMELKCLGEANPYPNSYNPENTKIEPTADSLKL